MPKGGENGIETILHENLGKKNTHTKWIIQQYIYIFLHYDYFSPIKRKRSGGKERGGGLFITIQEQSYTAFFL